MRRTSITAVALALLAPGLVAPFLSTAPAAAGEREARPAGRLRRQEELPVVGDWVVAEGASDSGAGPLRITAVLPRSTQLSRKVPGAQTAEQVVAAILEDLEG